MDSITYLNRYRLIPGENGTPVALQRGPGGVTYKAEDIGTGRTVAVKLAPAYSFDPAELQRLETDARAAQVVDHPNVARLYDFGHVERDVVFVTEVLDGTTLDEWIGHHGPLPAAAVVRIAIQAVSGLAAAAFHSVVHRSIQPANLMIVRGQTPDGEWPFVKIFNFGGLPYAASNSQSSPHLAGNSADFASPEQLEGHPVDFRSELYSLGCTIWFLLTGSPPAPGVPDKGGRVPRALRPILGRMVALDPAQRPQDPVVLEEQLRDCLATIERREAASAPPTSPVAATAPVPPSPRATSRNTMLLLKPLAYAAAILLLVGVAALAAPQFLRWRAARAAQPIGVPVGIPDASATPPAADSTSNAVANVRERTPAETDIVSPERPSTAVAAAPTAQTQAASASVSPIASSSPDTPDEPRMATVAGDTSVAEGPTSTQTAPAIVSASPPDPSSTPDDLDTAAFVGDTSVAEGPTSMQTAPALVSLPPPAPSSTPGEPDTDAVADDMSVGEGGPKLPPAVASMSPPDASSTRDTAHVADSMSVGEGPISSQTTPTLVSVPPPAPSDSPVTPAEQQTAAISADSGAELPNVAANTSTPTRVDDVATLAAEEPQPPTAGTPPITGEQIARESAEAGAANLPRSTTTAKATPSRKAAGSSDSPRKSKKKRQRATKAASKRPRQVQQDEVRPAEPVDPSEFENAPPVPRGSKRAKYLGTTAEGDLVFGLPFNERGIVARSATQAEQPRARGTRGVAPEPTPQAEMILPAEPVEADDE